MMYLGDFPEDATVYIPFNTFSSDDPSASVTITNLADADVKVHKDGSATQIVTDGATVAIDFDTITGNHLVTIDTSAHADYSTGSDYLVRIEGTTVDGATINAWVGTFSIENRFMRGTDSAALAATALSTATWTSARAGYIDNLNTGVSLAAGAITNASLAGNMEIVFETDFASNYDTTNDRWLTDAIAISGSTGAADSVEANIGNLDAAVSSTATTTELAKVPKSDGTTTWNNTALASINAECDTAISDYDPPTKAELDTAAGAVTLANGAHGGASATITLSDYSDFTGATASNPNVLQTTTITVSTQTSFTLAAGSSDDSAYENMVAVFTDQSTATQVSVRTISAYTGATKTVTIDSAPDFTIATGDTIDILAVAPGSTPPTAAQIVNEWESQSQADPTGFHVNVMEIGGIAQTGNDNGADINSIKVVTDNLPNSGALTDIDTGVNNLETRVPDTISLAAIQGECDSAITANTVILDLPTTAEFNARTLPSADYVIVSDLGTVQTGDTYALANGATGFAAIDTVVDSIKTKTDNLPQGIAKNTQLANFEFVMTDSTNHAPSTGLTVTATRSIDGAAFGACANSVTEVASGVYKITLAAADLNGDVITLRFTATASDDRLITITTNS